MIVQLSATSVAVRLDRSSVHVSPSLLYSIVVVPLAAFVVAGAPTPAVTDLATSKDTYLVSLDADHVKKLQEISPVYAESVIPAGTYSNQAEDVLTVGVKATIIANEQVSEEQAYTIVKTIFEGKDAITEAHAKGAELDLDYASSCGLPYHAGAAKYFAEKGITVETK